MTLKKLLALGTLALGALLPSASTAQEKAAPVVRLSDLQVDPARLAAFRAATVRHAETTSRREPGVLVHGVSLKPGKPTILAMIGEKPVFGLPGNPVSCMVTFDLFVAPTLHKLAGRSGGDHRQSVAARLSRNVE